MNTMVAIAIILYFVFLVQSHHLDVEEEEKRAFNLLQTIKAKDEKNHYKEFTASWNYESNITDINLERYLAVSAKVAESSKQIWKQIKQFNWRSFSDSDLKRQFMLYSVIDSSALPKTEYKYFIGNISEMKAIYATSKICDYQNKKKCDLAVEPELSDIFAKSRNEKELKHLWIEWRKAVGPKCKNNFKNYVKLSNQAAKLNNFKNEGDFWLFNYEDPNFKDQISKLWDQLKPLYLQMHAYVRYKLREKYGDIVTEKGPIPAHLLGNMWAKTWDNIASFTLPYPNVTDEDLTSEMLKQKYTPLKIFKTAENFFVSINLTAMPKSFWKKSILEKPTGRELVCHASAWDFYNGKDFRIKQCTGVNIEDMTTAHHEMGHIEYYLQYKDKPVIYRSGANDGFHEAIGDLIALSFRSTKHLRKIGLLKSHTDDSRIVLNNLYKVGLDKIAFLPFGYLIDLWRWEVFAGNITPANYNCKWWELREKYQGLEPPVDRSEEDFDPAGMFHIVANVPYLRYFISYVIQFQFHKALCEKAGQYEPNNPNKPLHECDIYENTVAGNALKKMLSMGSSKPWPDAMEVLTGQRNMDASGLLEYFKPLQEWLEKENAKNQVFIGWEKTKRVCVRRKKNWNRRSGKKH